MKTLPKPDFTLFSRRACGRHYGRARDWELSPTALVEFSKVSDGGAVLDVGSGIGALAFAVRDATTITRVLGIDLSPEYVSYASSSNVDARVRFEVGETQSLHVGFFEAILPPNGFVVFERLMTSG